MDWLLLGIAPTKDKKAITAAYREKLRHTNPEDKPEEFKALRQAYEEALSLADKDAQQPAADETPVGLWMEEVKKLYNDFPRRIDPQCWKLLLEEPVCIALDSRTQAEESLLKFLMEHFNLPQSVWQVLDNTFCFSQRTQELYETWPREFIDHAVIGGIRSEIGLIHSMFKPGINGADCDAYRDLYARANQMPLSEIGPLLEQMESLSESHPFGTAMRCRYWIENGKAEEGRSGFVKLIEEYPDHPLLVITWAEICLQDGDAQQAQCLAEHILTIDPGYGGAKIVIAKCLALKTEYKKAKEIAYEVIRQSGDNPGYVSQLIETVKKWNQDMIAICEEKYAQDPGDTSNNLELAWCYMQNERFDDAVAMAEKLDPDYDDQYEYHNFMGKLYFNTEQFEKCLHHMKITETILREMVDDGTEKTQKRISRLPEVLQIRGSCLMQLGHNDEAWEKLDSALADDPENVDLLSTMSRILFSSGDYEAAVDVIQRLLQLSDSAWFETLLALCLYRLHRDREAFEAIDRGLSLPDWDLSLYLLKMQILSRNGAYDGVHQILELLKEHNAPEDIALDFIRTQLVHLEQENEAAALKQYRALAKRVEAGENLFFQAELYYHLAVLTGNQLDVSLVENRKIVLDIVDKGLKNNDHDVDLLAYKAWVLKQGGLFEDAANMYRDLYAKNPKSTVILRSLADLYYSRLERYTEQALECYEKLLQTQKTPELYFFAATCKRYLGDFEGARNYYLKELEMDPEDADAYKGLAYLYTVRGDYETALKMLDQSLEILQQYQQRDDWAVERKSDLLRRMGRFEEALAFMADAQQRHGFADAMQVQFEICCQFGLWDRAKDVLASWKRQNSNDPHMMAAKARLCLLQGKMFGAAFAMGSVKHKLPIGMIEEFRIQLADMECNCKRKVELYSHRVNREPKDECALAHLAHAYWIAGQTDAARGAAKKALGMIDRILEGHLTDELLYRTRRCLMLAILGQHEQALQELENCRKKPLCERCEYCRCKDADIFEAYIAEIMGNREQAQKLYAAGVQNWPDELDFISGQKRLNRKERK